MRLSPLARRRVLEPLVGVLRGSAERRELARLERTQFLPQAELIAQQRDRLQRLVRRVYATSPFYRTRFDQCGLRPEDVGSAEDLGRLPVLTKHIVRTEFDRIIAPGRHRRRLQEARTGGSTGVPLVLYFTEEVSAYRNAAARRSNRWAGWEVGEPVGAVWGNPHPSTTLREKLRAWAHNPVIYLDTMQLRPDTVAAFSEAWQRVGATLLYGHAHSLYMLARLLRDQGIGAIRPKGIVATSMMLLPHERAVIDQVFGVRVSDRYGCEEVGLIGAECEEHDGLHMNVDHLLIEFVRDDGSRAAVGEPAHVVVTDLLNEEMPLIRYDVGDIAAESARVCSCGRGLPLMEGLAGRVADFLKRSDGTMVAGVSLIENSLTKFPGIEQLQIVQESLTAIRLRLVPDSRFRGSAHNDLIGYFTSTFPDCSVDVELVEEIPREPNGKYRFAICHVPD